MEGSQVGNTNVMASDELRLLWPKNLMAELAASRRRHFWSTPLIITTYILATLLAIAIGPVQLILLILTQNYVMVTEIYYPNAMKIALLLSGMLAIMTAVAMYRAWREQPKRSLMVSILGLGSAAIILVIWIAGFLVNFQPNQLAFLLTLIAVAGWVLAVVVARQFFSPEQPHRLLYGLLLGAFLLGVIETIFAGIYIFSQTNAAKEEQTALEALGQAQTAAQIDGITPQLSDLIYTLCGGTYDAVYIPMNQDRSGLFECRESSEVYSVSGPNEPISDTARVIAGSAFYFGKTKDQYISVYFPANSGVKYLYRDLSGTDDTPSELIMLVPAATEEIAVNAYLDQFVLLVNNREASNPLLLSIFYNAETNTVINTKDFILLAAADTLALTDFLPRGKNYQGYLNGLSGTYMYTPDLTLDALKELGLSPLLYSSQTRDAINTNRHITVELAPDHEYTADELRELFYANFIAPTTE